jgi:hypothetical protein
MGASFLLGDYIRHIYALGRSVGIIGARWYVSLRVGCGGICHCFSISYRFIAVVLSVKRAATDIISLSNTILVIPFACSFPLFSFLLPPSTSRCSSDCDIRLPNRYVPVCRVPVVGTGTFQHRYPLPYAYVI